VLDTTGKVIAKLGDFDGISEQGLVRGLLFPASLAFGLDGNSTCRTSLVSALRRGAGRGRFAMDA
jgi:hypothetical protein